MIYIDDNIGDFDLDAALKAVSPERRAYAMKYVHQLDRRLSVASFLLLKRALSLEWGLDSVPPFVYDSSGKPQLEGHPDIHFNLSHCRQAVACVVGRNPVGIDVECIESLDHGVLAMTMSPIEQERIAASPLPEVEFTRLWTMKESLYKLTGQYRDKDIRLMLEDSAGYHFHTTVYPRFICTVCTP